MFQVQGYRDGWFQWKYIFLGAFGLQEQSYNYQLLPVVQFKLL